jgi:cytoskeletal protein RodZ
LWLVAALVLLAVAIAGWYLVHHRSKPTTPAQVQPHVAEGPLGPSTAVAKPQGSPSSVSDNAAQNSASAFTPTKSEPNPAPELSKTSGAHISGASSNLGGPSEHAPILLEVIAHEDSWLSVFADGKSLGEEILLAQKIRKIRAQREIRLKVGNVGGVEVSFNGKPVNIDGESKQVKEFTFTTNGLRQ